jgi:hypothetical protein
MLLQFMGPSWVSTALERRFAGAGVAIVTVV